MSSTSDKISATIQTLVVFIIVSLPATYKLTNGLFGLFGLELAEPSGCPTLTGILVHALVFAVIIYILMVTNPLSIK
jgi:hypothetical protein